MTLSIADKQALSDIVNETHLKGFLQRYCEDRVADLNKQCAMAMRPMASVEDAKSYAAQSLVYENFVSDLEELERKQ